MRDITVLEARPLPDFVETPFIRGIVERALAYIEAGFPIHFRGPTGTGKTTLAFHVAGILGRPIVFIHGDEEYSTSDLVGGEYGYRIRKMIDNFIHSVLRTEEEMTSRWIDNRLTIACQYGFTLIYDEFTRSRLEANNILISVLQEKILGLPAARGEGYLKVHPQFTAIFTSNPEEYAGVFRTQDALRDRMITIDLEHFDEETEISITQARSGLDREDAQKIVWVVRGLRESGVCEFVPTVRACLKIARTLKCRNGSVTARDGLFRTLCLEILASEASRGVDKALTSRIKEVINQLIDRYCA